MAECKFSTLWIRLLTCGRTAGASLRLVRINFDRAMATESLLDLRASRRRLSVVEVELEVGIEVC